MSFKLRAIAIAIIIGTASIMYSNYAAKQVQIHEAEARKKVAIGGAFTLTNQNGKTISNTYFEDKLMLVFFGYTSCPDVCPTGLQVITTVMDELVAQAQHVAPIFITVDPERDTTEQLHSYLSEFHPSIVGLTGTDEQTKQVTGAYKVYANKMEADEEGNYMVNHSGFIYLMDRNGYYLAHFPHNEAPEKLIKTIRKYL